MKTFYVNLPYYRGDVKVNLQHYAADGSTAIALFDKDGPVARCTVCIPGAGIKPNEVLIKSWSENKGMAAELMRLGIIGPIKGTVLSGWVEATVHDLLYKGPFE